MINEYAVPIVAGQVVLDGRGGMIRTPSVTLGPISIGKFALSDGSTQTGFRFKTGQTQPGTLYPVQFSPDLMKPPTINTGLK